MNATLHFDLSDPDQKREHMDCLNGVKFKVILETLDQHLRGELKYSRLNKQASEKLEAIHSLMWRELKEEGIDLYE